MVTMIVISLIMAFFNVPWIYTESLEAIVLCFISDALWLNAISRGGKK